LEQTFNAAECERLVIRNDRYNCDISQPWHRCTSDEQCPAGELCGEGMVPQLCAKCNMDKIANTYYEYANISVNFTASMLAGNFWTTDQFYNHTGVDLILTLYALLVDYNLFIFISFCVFIFNDTPSTTPQGKLGVESGHERPAPRSGGASSFHLA
jgi:hypothetical protein